MDEVCSACLRGRVIDGVPHPMILRSRDLLTDSASADRYHLACLPPSAEAELRPQHGERIDAAKSAMPAPQAPPQMAAVSTRPREI